MDGEHSVFSLSGSFGFGLVEKLPRYGWAVCSVGQVRHIALLLSGSINVYPLIRTSLSSILGSRITGQCSSIIETDFYIYL